MSLSDDAIELQVKVSLSSTTWPTSPTLEEAPGSRAMIASLLAHTIGSAEPRFVHAVVDEPEGAPTLVKVTVFTDDIVVIVTGYDAPSAVSIPRAALKSISITSVPNVISNDGWTAGTPLRVQLDYGDALDDLVVLGHRGQPPRNAAEMAEFLSELHSDLKR